MSPHRVLALALASAATLVLGVVPPGAAAHVAMRLVVAAPSCLQPTADGGLQGTFTVTNTTGAPISIPAGLDDPTGDGVNSITDDPTGAANPLVADWGQPGTFDPGATRWTAMWPSGVIVWKLDGSTVSVDPSSTPRCPADVAITKHASAPTVAPGGTVLWTLTVTNAGPANTDGVQVRDRLPAGLVLTGVSRAWSYDAASRTVTVPVGFLAAHGALDIVVATSVEAAAADGTVLTNHADVCTDSPDCDDTNNTTSATTTVVVPAPQPPLTPGTPATPVAPVTPTAPSGGSGPAVTAPERTDLRLAKTANRATAYAGERVVFTLTVRNTGRTAARDVRVCDVLPPMMTIVRAPGARIVDGRACWMRGTLRAGATLVVRITVRVDRTAAPGRITNRASVRAANADSARAATPLRILPARTESGPAIGVTG